jgi:hypothetical protein
MGVLEDAIREHLDLKRRHGASDEELSHQEAEALGPARRDVPEAENEPSADDTAHTAVVPVEPGAAMEPPVEPAAVEPAPPVQEQSEPAPEPEAPPAPADQDTIMYSPGESPEDPDPDFAGEAPEQKPPGDLDFD